MKKRLIITMAMVLMFALIAVGCNKDKDVSEPTTEALASTTTEPTTKFEAPEIKDEPTTEETTEAPETTKKPTYSYSSSGSSSSSNSGSSSSGSSGSSNTVNNSGRDLLEGETLEDGRVVVVTNANGGGIYLESNFGANTGGHGSDTDPRDWYQDGVIDAADDEYLKELETCSVTGRG